MSLICPILYNSQVMHGPESKASTEHSRHPPWLLALLTTGLVVAVCYIGLELAARSDKIVDSDKADLISAAADPRRELSDLASETMAIYGWDRPPIPIPPTDTADPLSPDVLFIGDSVTRGFELAEPERQSFPALLRAALSVDTPLSVVNAAVPGFGVDQMVLKLGSELARRKPRLVIVAYIPHDLYRSGRNINFGVPKPVLSRYSGGTWEMRPAPDLFDFYLGYLEARSGLRLGAWWLRFIADNAQYYLPMFNRTVYETRFEGIRENLHDLFREHGVRIVLVRLANGELDDSVAVLDQWATQVFTTSTSSSPRFVDVEPCSSRHAAAKGLDVDKDFDRHPGAPAHAIFAQCLSSVVTEELAAQP
jgi:hypothetical protein